MDFLGLKTLTFIKKVQDQIRKRGSEWKNFNTDTVPLEDEATFRLLCEGESEGIFQFESQGMKEILKQAKPSSINDLIAINALYRPGPMVFIPQFIQAKLGLKGIEYPDPCLEPFLKETHGIIVFQEQIIQIIHRISGYCLAYSDILRRIMAKNDLEELNEQKKVFSESACINGFEENDSNRLFDIIASLSRFTFPKSHSVAYTMISWRTAYLKANFREEFEKVLNIDPSRERPS